MDIQVEAMWHIQASVSVRCMCGVDDEIQLYIDGGAQRVCLACV